MIRREAAGIRAEAVLMRQALVTSEVLLPCSFSARAIGADGFTQRGVHMNVFPVVFLLLLFSCCFK